MMVIKLIITGKPVEDVAVTSHCLTQQRIGPSDYYHIRCKFSLAIITCKKKSDVKLQSVEYLFIMRLFYNMRSIMILP